jgi:hypothetical protein
VSLREGLANLACKLRRLEVHVRAWCHHGLVATSQYGVAWCHCTDRGGTVGMLVVPPAILCDMVYAVVFIIVF